MAIEIPIKLLTFLVVVDSLVPTTIAKYHSNNKSKLKTRCSVVHYYVIHLIICYGLPPLTMDAVLATIFDSRRVIC